MTVCHTDGWARELWLGHGPAGARLRTLTRQLLLSSVRLSWSTVRTLQSAWLPAAAARNRKFLWVFPAAVEQLVPTEKGAVSNCQDVRRISVLPGSCHLSTWPLQFQLGLGLV